MLEVTFSRHDYLHPKKLNPCSKHRPYIIATTQRSGSTLLSDLLLQTGICGQPGEYLTDSFVARNDDLLKFCGNNPINKKLKSYVNHISSCYHSNNDISGLKVTWDQVLKICHDLQIPFHWRNCLKNSFKYYFGSPKIIFLRRANIVSQAISKYLAFQTNKWHSWDKENQDAQIEFSSTSIISIINEINSHNEGWLNLFESCNSQFINVFYEELCLSPLDIIKNVIEFIHEDNVTLKNVPSKSIKPVNSVLKSEFESKFMKELYKDHTY